MRASPASQVTIAIRTAKNLSLGVTHGDEILVVHKERELLGPETQRILIVSSSYLNSATK